MSVAKSAGWKSDVIRTTFLYMQVFCHAAWNTEVFLTWSTNVSVLSAVISKYGN